MRVFLSFLSLFVVGSIADDGYVCAGNYLINPPLNLSEPYYFPENWNESQYPAVYQDQQNCEWQINVLKGMFAKVIFYKFTESESGITATYANQEVVYIEDKELNPFIFAGPQFRVNMRVAGNNNGQSRFSFKVVWSQYPAACTMKINLQDTQPMIVAPSSCVTTVTAPHRVILAGFNVEEGNEVLLRQSVVIEGDSLNGEYVGNLYAARYNQIESTGKQLTIYTFDLDRNFNDTLYMVMDTYAAGTVERFNGLNCPSNPATPCYITVNSYQNVSAVATVGRQIDYIQPFLEFPQGASLKVYEGKISDDALLATLNRSNFQNQLPLGVKNFLKIYVLDSGRITMPLTRNSAVANYETVYDGRIVRIHSFDLGRPSYMQDTSEIFSASSEKLYFNFNVKFFDSINGATLAVLLLRDTKVIFSEIYSDTNQPPPNTLKVYGDQMQVKYNTYGSFASGFRIDLTTTKNENDFSPIPSSAPFTSPSTSTLRISSSPTISTSPGALGSSTVSPTSTGSTTVAAGSDTTVITSQNFETTTKSSAILRFSLTASTLIAVYFF